MSAQTVYPEKQNIMETRDRQVVSVKEQVLRDQLIQLEMDYATLCLRITQVYQTCGKSDEEIAQLCEWSTRKVKRIGTRGPSDHLSYRDLMVFVWACGAKLAATVEPFSK